MIHSHGSVTDAGGRNYTYEYGSFDYSSTNTKKESEMISERDKLQEKIDWRLSQIEKRRDELEAAQLKLEAAETALNAYDEEKQLTEIIVGDLLFECGVCEHDLEHPMKCKVIVSNIEDTLQDCKPIYPIYDCDNCDWKYIGLVDKIVKVK